MAAPHDHSSNTSSGSARTVNTPRRRQQPVQPPNLLTTSLGNARSAGLGIGGITQTPVSSTSLSSPFSMNTQSAGGAVRGASPMALRSQASFSVNYNPQQWGPVNSNTLAPSSVGDYRQAQSSRVATTTLRPLGPDGK